MKVLMFSEDAKILELGSDVAGRMQKYADILGELYIIVTGKGNTFSVKNLYISPAKLRAFGMFVAGWKLCRKNKFDVISAQGADDIGMVSFLLSCLFNIPFQLQLHTDILSPWYRRASWKERVRYWIAFFLIPRADSIRVVSERIKKSILNHPLSTIRHLRIYVLPIFTDFAKYFTAKRNSETDRRFELYDFKLIAVGRFVEKEKNFLMLIDVMKDFVKVCPKALLIIVGEGSNKKNYELRIKNYGLEENIFLDPWRSDLESFYKSFDLFLLSSNYEGWGMVVLEAMASGLPVIMTDVGLAGEVVRDGENGLVVPVQNRDEFLQAVEMLYKNSEKRKNLSARGFETVKNLEPKTKEEYLKKYKESFEL